MDNLVITVNCDYEYEYFKLRGLKISFLCWSSESWLVIGSYFENATMSRRPCRSCWSLTQLPTLTHELKHDTE